MNEPHEKEIVIHRVCEECEGTYPLQLEYSLTKIDELNQLVSEGKYVLTETEDKLIYRKTWFVCQDCAHSTRMNDTTAGEFDSEQLQAEIDKVLDLDEAEKVLRKHATQNKQYLADLQRQRKGT